MNGRELPASMYSSGGGTGQGFDRPALQQAIQDGFDSGAITVWVWTEPAEGGLVPEYPPSTNWDPHST